MAPTSGMAPWGLPLRSDLARRWTILPILTITHQRFTGWVRRLVRWVLSLSKFEFVYEGVGGAWRNALNCGCGITYGVFLSMFTLNVWPHFALSNLVQHYKSFFLSHYIGLVPWHKHQLCVTDVLALTVTDVFVSNQWLPVLFLTVSVRSLIVFRVNVYALNIIYA